jgi:signal transduction histidine kinase
LLFGGYVLLSALSILFTLLPALASESAPPADVFNVVFPIFLIPYSVTGFILTRRSPENVVGWMMSATGFLWILSAFAETYSSAAVELDLPFVSVTAWLATWPWVTAAAAVGIFMLLFFPDGKLPSPRWRFAFYIGLAGTVLATFASAVSNEESTEAGISNPLAIDSPVVNLVQTIGFSLILAGFLLATIALFVRLRTSRGEQRQQVKWVAYVATFIFPALFTAALGEGIAYLLPNWVGAVGWFTLLTVLLIALPLAIGIAILRYRLYDIDVVISKTIVFGLLAAFITAVYVAIVVGIGTALGSSDEPNLALSIAATAIVAIAFSPVKERTQRIANRLVYGRRATPYEALARFTEEVAQTYETERVAPAMAETIVSATGAERAEVWLAVDHSLVRTAAAPERDEIPLEAMVLPEDGEVTDIEGADVTAPVIHNGELLGALTLTKKRGEQASPLDRKLLSDLASQAGIVLRNSRLTAELRARLDQITVTATEIRASRQRIVAAQDKARRALERDIHDGAQQHLVALAVKLNLAKTMATKKPERAEAMLEQLEGEIQDALDTLDELARGIYPPILSEGGIARAIEARADKATFAITVNDETTRRFDPHTEAAVYFCILEALQNTAKYANATTATVTLQEQDSSLSFTVTDDGDGFDPATTELGTGVEGMSDRLAAVGGTVSLTSAPGAGTTVIGSVPIQATVAS